MRNFSLFFLLISALFLNFFLFNERANQEKNLIKSELQKPKRVIIAKNTFIPPIVEIKRGESVTWFNEEKIPHQVKSRIEGVFKSKVLNKEEEFSFIFTEVGEYNYFCLIHPQEGGKIFVK